ncbi:hypothetical protein LTR66_012986, partial [Elasticomyces elasticus]
MIEHADEVPTTYLNKGQKYSVSVLDTAPQQAIAGRLRYRTLFRISFEDEQQRQRSRECWQLWKAGRGANEAHQRGGRLQAVEYVGPNYAGRIDDLGQPRIELETSSFDEFSVKWTPPAHGGTECSIEIRFNFLSTDFTHFKGVKGIPVRFCAKTELIGSPALPLLQRSNPEISYCKVKLFRDHGAERKLSNDVAHVKKIIDRLTEQTARAETGTGNLGKRKRSGPTLKAIANTRPGKVPKNKRTWSMSSVGPANVRATVEEDPHLKLAALQEMFSSTRTTSVLYLRGTEQDDSGVHPVHLVVEPRDLMKTETNDAETPMWNGRSIDTTRTSSSIVSPTPSAHSLPSVSRRDITLQQRTPFGTPSCASSNEWRNHLHTVIADLHSSNPQQLVSLPDQPTRVQTRSSRTGTLTGWIEALDVDCSYQPPPERIVKPVACIYIQPEFVGKPLENNYYRAIYLMQRTAKDLVNRIAVKCNVKPGRVLQTIRVNRLGLDILLDDESVRELQDGQDLVAEFKVIKLHTSTRCRRDAGPTDVQDDGSVGSVEDVNSVGYELRLHY